MSVQAAAIPAAKSIVAVVDGMRRAVIENVRPEVDAGRFPIKRVVGETVAVEADVFADGHDAVRCVLRHRHEQQAAWRETEMQALANDVFRAEFAVDELGRYRYTILAWVDRFQSWRQEFARRIESADILLAAIIGAELVEEAASRAAATDVQALQSWAHRLRSERDPVQLKRLGMDDALWKIAARHPDRSRASAYERELEVIVDRPLARFSAWYEFFPRSCASEPGRHGTFRDCETRLDYIAQLGFDIVYLPPIHPIGRVARKGANNALKASPQDSGSPWAIGSQEGGHMAVQPQLGTLADFRRLLASARA